MKARRHGKIGMAALTALAVSGAFASVSMSKVREYTFSIDGCGGITYAGDGHFYVLQDHDSDNKSRVYPVDINIVQSSGAISSLTIHTGDSFRPGTNGDSEGIAFDPGSGCLWISDEATPTIKEFLTSGMAQRSAPVPSLQQLYKRANKSLESLTISGDGLTMWTANEEALTCDGPASQGDSSVMTLVRLVRYSRSSLLSPWTPSGQWVYRCDQCCPSLISSYKQSGLSGMCALPDGSLLMLEREVSTSTWGRCRIYRVAETEFTPDKDVTNIPSLANASYTRVGTQRLLDFEGDGRKEIIVYEGICLGPRLADGSLSVLLISDGGATKTLDFGIGTISAKTVSRICACRLTGLNVRTVNLNAPTGATASTVGQNFRYLAGTRLSVSVSAPDLDPVAYTNNGAIRATATYSLANGTVSGFDGNTVSFTVANDETLSWQITRGPAVSDVYDFDTFEEYAAGTTASGITGWNGDCETVAETYAPPTPPGYPMQRAATHLKVLDTGDESCRALSVQPGSNRKFDMMVQVSRGALEGVPCTDDMQIALAADIAGKFHLWHRRQSGGSWTKGWTKISDTQFADGEWVRVTFDMDYTSNPSGMAFARVLLNGVECTSAQGYASPSSMTSNGPWHRLACGNAAPSLFGAMSTKVDDFIVTTMGYTPEIAVTPSMSISVAPAPASVGGQAFAVAPVAAAPAPAANGIGAVQGEQEAADGPKIVKIAFRDGRPVITILGYRDGDRILVSSTPGFADAADAGGKFEVDGATGECAWTGDAPIASGPGAAPVFYRIAPAAR